ncbi:MAG: electron transport complex subunit RsxB [Methylococcaceae bacterium]
MTLLFAIITLTALGLGLGFLLGMAARYFKVEHNPLVEEIEQMLPGSQCGQCGFPGCRPAAEALVSGNAGARLCPPGGLVLAERLAERLALDLDATGLEATRNSIARISEATCIGCARCFKACPTDAIVGAPKQIHAVVSEACTACGRCVAVCPTECLTLHTVEVTLGNWRWQKPQWVGAGG